MFIIIRRRHVTGTFSALLLLSEGNPAYFLIFMTGHIISSVKKHIDASQPDRRCQSVTYIFHSNWLSDAVTSENYWRITPLMTTNIVINYSLYIIVFYTWFSGSETQINRWTPIDRSPVHCCGIVTSPKHLLWRHFDRLSWKRFQVGHVRLPAVVKLIITR